MTKILYGMALGVIFIRTMSYAAYQWRQGNTFGAAGLAVMGLAALVLPMAAVWLRL